VSIVIPGIGQNEFIISATGIGLMLRLGEKNLVMVADTGRALISVPIRVIARYVEW
jgi:hypothetical protein